MGYYEGQRERPCPRCGGLVSTLFISVAPMSFYQRCGGCGTSEFTPEEDAQMGGNAPRQWDIERDAAGHRSLEMTRRYVKLLPRVSRDAANRINEAIG